MSSNRNFYNNFTSNRLTFHASFPPPTFIPPPPVPPKFFIPAVLPQTNSNTPKSPDQDYIKDFESKIVCPKTPKKLKLPSISEIRQELKDMVVILNELKDKEKILSEKINTSTDSEWQAILKQVEINKAKIDEILSKINDHYMDTLRKVIAKRTAKRLRLKRIRLEKKREKEKWIKQCEEKSRKIDENLQKIKNENDKKKQEDEAKLQADSILKEVLRKKHDGKKCLVKLDALMKLRKARENTAKGRGEKVSESEATAFNRNIEKLKSMWAQKLIVYENEESNLRDKLKEDISRESDTLNNSEKQVNANLSKWREYLFGGTDALPQYDFNGDMARFIAVRSEWDQFISNEGTSLPMGWVVPMGKP